MSSRGDKKRKAEGGAGGPAQARRLAEQPPRSAALESALEASRELYVDADTQRYFEEMAAALERAPGPQAEAGEEEADQAERALLVSSALREARGQEVALAMDAACSRVLQRLLGAASGTELVAFAGGLAGYAVPLFCSPFGSHVSETLLDALRVASGPAEARRGAECSCEAVAAALQPLAEELAPHALELAPHQAASPALRALLGCLAGRCVGREERAVGPPAPAVLPADPAVRAPRALRRFASTLLAGLESAGEEFWAVTATPAGSALLQALAQAHAPFPRDLQPLLPRLLGAQRAGAPPPPAAANAAAGGAGLRFACVPASAVAQLLRDPAGSRLAECLLSLAPQPLRCELFSRFMAGGVPALAAHGCANFALQAWLRALAAGDEPQLQAALAELAPQLGELLQRSRGGVVAALLGACARLGCCEKEAAKALSRALVTAYAAPGEHPASTASSSYLAQLAPALLRRVSGGTTRNGYSLLGCSCLSALLAFAPPAARAFADSLAALAPAEARAAAEDPAASRCLEALLRGPSAPPGVRRKLLQQLAPAWAALGAHPVGSHVLDAAFDAGEAREREAIVGALADCVRALAATRHGPALMARLGVADFKRDPGAWRCRHAAAARVAASFADILQDGDVLPAAQAAPTPISAPAPSQPKGRRQEAGRDKKTGSNVAELSREVQRALSALHR